MKTTDGRFKMAMDMYALACNRADAKEEVCVLLRREVQELKETVQELRLQLLEQRFRGAYED